MMLQPLVSLGSIWIQWRSGPKNCGYRIEGEGRAVCYRILAASAAESASAIATGGA